MSRANWQVRRGHGGGGEAPSPSPCSGGAREGGGGGAGGVAMASSATTGATQTSSVWLFSKNEPCERFNTEQLRKIQGLVDRVSQTIYRLPFFLSVIVFASWGLTETNPSPHPSSLGSTVRFQQQITAPLMKSGPRSVSVVPCSGSSIVLSLQCFVRARAIRGISSVRQRGLGAPEAA